MRSGFSYGYGVATPAELLEEAARTGMRSMALTDRDGLYGIPRFLEAAGEVGVSPVVGAEVGVEVGACPGGHLVLLAEGMEGYRSLCRLITAYRCSSGDRRRPACPLATVLEHAAGLVCLTGAIPFGLLPRLVLSGRGDRAAEVAGLLREAFG
ncbi:MAG TPA: PHP domain-containing protein, partial [Thermoanaerobaculia bacterium]